MNECIMCGKQEDMGVCDECLKLVLKTTRFQTMVKPKLIEKYRIDVGRPKGTPQSQEAKDAISKGMKKVWEERNKLLKRYKSGSDG